AVDGHDIDAILPQRLEDVLELALLHGEVAIDKGVVIGAVEGGPGVDAHLLPGDAVAGHLRGAAKSGLVHAILGLALSAEGGVEWSGGNRAFVAEGFVSESGGRLRRAKTDRVNGVHHFLYAASQLLERPFATDVHE